MGMHIKNEEMKEDDGIFLFRNTVRTGRAAGRSRIFESLGWGNSRRSTKLEFSVA